MDFDASHILLVVDDDSSNLDVIIKCFQDRPFRILYAPNGQKGYEVAIKEPPNIIIMDWTMPVMNGIDTTLKLKATEITKSIPILMATGVMTSSEDLQRALEAGAIDYIRKPFDPLELRARVNTALTLSLSFQEINRQKNEIRELLEKEKVLLQEQLDFKERELSIQALHAQEKIQLLAKIKDSLESLKKEADLADSNKTYHKLMKNIRSGLDNNKHAENFLYHFQHVHPQFLEKIKELGSELTTNEIKLCSYIKMGMNNKEIAQVSGVELGTIKSNINRLKKKLQLSPEDPLRTFITNLN